MDLVSRRLTWHWTNGFGFDFRSDARESSILPLLSIVPYCFGLLFVEQLASGSAFWAALICCSLGSCHLVLFWPTLCCYQCFCGSLWMAGSYQAGGPGPSSATGRRIKTNIPTAWVAFYTQVLPFIPWLSSNTATMNLFASGGKLELSEFFNFQVVINYINQRHKIACDTNNKRKNPSMICERNR